jgi:uncharacterized membrane protein
MIDIREQGQQSDIILSPNCSASWPDNVRIFKAILTFNAICGLFFIAHGAWLVLPFMGLELMFFYLILSSTFRKLQIRQIVSVNPQNLRISLGHKTCEHQWQWPRQNSCVLVTELPHPWDPLQISISHCGEYVCVGGFLNKDDSRKLLSALRKSGLPVRHFCAETSLEV